METIKNILRKLALLSPIAVTKNISYDRLSRQILRKVLKPDSNCIDVGCHKGEFLDMIISLAPKGHHHGFEPIPELYNSLKFAYGNNASIHHLALSNRKGQLRFQHVKNFPAYSGFRKRDYDGKNVNIEEIEVQTDLLDAVLPSAFPVRLIKIDVEGAEFEVLEGATKTIRKWKPFVIFEFGKGAADHYDTTPEMIFNFFETADMSVNTLKGWMQSAESMSLEVFQTYFQNGNEYYFIAYSESSTN